MLHKLFGSEEVFNIHNDDVAQYAVVRFAQESEEIVIDLIGKIGEISFDVANKDREEVEIEGVIIPVCGLSTLIETKKGVRPKDQEDLIFLTGKKGYLERHRKNNS